MNLAARWAGLIGPGGILAAGAGLAWASSVHPAEMPPWAPWDFSWLVFLGCTLALWWYAMGLVRIAPAARPSHTRQALYVAGVALTYAVLQTRFENMALHMFFLNRVQHMVIHHLGPFLIALAWPGETLQHGLPSALRRATDHPAVQVGLRVIQQPAIAGILFVGLILLWLIPPVHIRAMLNPTLYTLMNASMVADGVLFWVLVLDPRPSPPARTSFASRLVLVMAVQVPQIALGAAIALAGHDLYPVYALCGRLFPGIGAVLDQQIGGFVVWVPGGMMSTVAGLILFARLWEADKMIADGRDPAAGGPLMPQQSGSGA